MERNVSWPDWTPGSVRLFELLHTSTLASLFASNKATRNNRDRLQPAQRHANLFTGKTCAEPVPSTVRKQHKPCNRIHHPRTILDGKISRQRADGEILKIHFRAWESDKNPTFAMKCHISTPASATSSHRGPGPSNGLARGFAIVCASPFGFLLRPCKEIPC